ncbi:F-box protein skip23 [Rhynchospora pubera]|uniref:F-box protein skip23 n=1 Tax=Rhynchospora pubera TaxID=906938 RepID=A0AAV8H4Q6_9POAL|nr:F-box protein skip23 [Rhynchospora pubera]
MAPLQKKARKAYNHNHTQTSVNWAELHPDMLRIISSKLCDFGSFVKFRAVCKSWRSAADLSECPRQFPCLVDWPHMQQNTTLRVYSPASCTSHIFQVPNALCYGPFGGELLMKPNCPMKMPLFYLNPLTGVKTAFPFEVQLRNSRPTGAYWLHSRIDEFAVGKEGLRHVFYFKISENDEWTRKEIDDKLRAVAYHDHKYFLLEARNVHLSVLVINKTNGAELPSIPFPNSFTSLNYPFNYLVATTNGLLAIIGFKPLFVKDLKDCRFEVHRQENYPENPHWTKLNGIGDLILFVDHFNCFALKASDYHCFEGNCIYFISSVQKPKHGSKHVIGRFHMGLNTIEELSGPTWFGKGNSTVNSAWFLPSI